MEIFVGYFLFWLYFTLSLVGVMMSVGCAFFGGLFAYEEYVLKTQPDEMNVIASICVCIVGICSTGAMLALCKFVLNPIYKSLPNLL